MCIFSACPTSSYILDLFLWMLNCRWRFPNSSMIVLDVLPCSMIRCDSCWSVSISKCSIILSKTPTHVLVCDVPILLELEVMLVNNTSTSTSTGTTKHRSRLERRNIRRANGPRRVRKRVTSTFPLPRGRFTSPFIPLHRDDFGPKVLESNCLISAFLRFGTFSPSTLAST